MEQRIQIVQLYYENSRSIKNTFRKLRNFYPRHNRANEHLIRNVVQRFETTGSVVITPTKNRLRSGRSSENIA